MPEAVPFPVFDGPGVRVAGGSWGWGRPQTVGNSILLPSSLPPGTTRHWTPSSAACSVGVATQLLARDSLSQFDRRGGWGNATHPFSLFAARLMARTGRSRPESADQERGGLTRSRGMRVSSDATMPTIEGSLLARWYDVALEEA